MSRWLLVGEGPTELGSEKRDGLLDALLRQLANAEDDLATALGCERWSRVQLPEVVKHTPQQLALILRLPPGGGLAGKGKDLARALRAARIEQATALLFVVDGDHHSPERHVQITRAREHDGLPCAASIAQETADAWILADPDIAVGGTVPRKAPEDLWGSPEDPKSDHPKMVLRRVLRNSRLTLPEAIALWGAARAAPRTPRLADFCRQIVELLRDPALCEVQGGE